MIALGTGGLVLLAVSAGLSGAGAQPGKGRTIGVVSFYNADTPSAIVIKSYTGAAKKLGYTITAVDSKASPATAVQAMQNFAQRKVDAIAVQLWQVNQVRAGMNAARAADIPVIGISSNALGGRQGYRYVTEFGPKSGRVLGNHIARTTKGSAALLIIGYSPGTVARTREEGLKAELKRVRGIKITRNELNVTDINASTTNSVNAWLGRNPEGSARNLMVWLPSSCCVLPAVNALRQAGRTDVKVYGFVDGTKAVMRPLLQGHVTAMAADDLLGQGRAAARATLSVIRGGVSGPQRQVALAPELVTRANARAFMKRHPELS